MPFLLVRKDITKMHVDAIVNAANNSLLGGGGVDGAIHRAAGPQLLAECRTLGGCATGDAKRTRAYDLPCQYVIHTVGPIWQGGEYGERELLRSCYARSLQLALEAGCESVAFPLISAGVYGYPKAQAVEVASQTILEFLQSWDMTVFLVLFDPQALNAAEERFGEIRQFIDDAYVQRAYASDPRSRMGESAFSAPTPMADMLEGDENRAARSKLLFAPRKLDKGSKAGRDKGAASDVCGGGEKELAAYSSSAGMSLESMLGQLDESFAQMLLRLIDQKGMSDAQCYKKANIDRKLFSKIRSNPLYKPSKNTAIAFAIALELPMEETRELLAKAGFALSHSSKFDIIIEYYILSGNYDLFAINETLFAFDQSLLGA